MFFQLTIGGKRLVNIGTDPEKETEYHYWKDRAEQFEALLILDGRKNLELIQGVRAGRDALYHTAMEVLKLFPYGPGYTPQQNRALASLAAVLERTKT
jgi:hypothetical protein